jgi:hypothetical protein
VLIGLVRWLFVGQAGFPRTSPHRRAAPPQALFTGIVQGLAEITSIDKQKGTSAWSEFDEFQTMTIKFPPGILHIQGTFGVI